ncbi:MAG: hypothetical protein JWL95_1681, partial [Gemmatimonadetes bacterium]|nr:hypothetical protein [Gemmatimonadota bacterium]
SATTHGLQRVLLQVERETADAYEAYGTPSAIVVSSEGLIASEVAQGAAELRVLLGSVVGTAASNGNGAHARNGGGAPRWSEGSLASASRIGADAR